MAQVFKVQVSWEALRPALLARRRARAAAGRASAAGDVCPAMGCADWGSGEAEPVGNPQPVAGPAAAEPVEVRAVEAAASPCGSGSDHEVGMDAEPQPAASPAVVAGPAMPVHFAVAGAPPLEYVPYFEVQDEASTCFPRVRAEEP